MFTTCYQCQRTVLQTDKFCSGCGAAVALPLNQPSLDVNKSAYGYAGIPMVTAEPVARMQMPAMAVPMPMMAVQVAPSSQPARPPLGLIPSASQVRLVLTKRGSSNAIRFSHSSLLKTGGTVSATLSSHSGQGLGRCYAEERRYGPWRYTEAACGEGAAPVNIKLVDGKYIFVEGADLCLDVSFWKMYAGNTVNWVGGTGNTTTPTKLGGGGRDWTVEHDGSVSVKTRSDLVLGFAEKIDAEDMEGCYGCCCLPCGSACFRNKSEGPDKYKETGIFFWFFGVPIPYTKTRARKGNNVFTNIHDTNDHCAWLAPGVIRTEGASCAWKMSD